METIKHLESKFSIASYELIKTCHPLELKFYLWLKLWAINKHEAWPGYTTICEEIGITRATLVSLIEKMEKVGRLKVTRNAGANNVYDITNYDLLATSIEIKPTSLKTIPPASLKIKPELIESKRIENNYTQQNDFENKKAVDPAVLDRTKEQLKRVLAK